VLTSILPSARLIPRGSVARIFVAYHSFTELRLGSVDRRGRQRCPPCGYRWYQPIECGSGVSHQIPRRHLRHTGVRVPVVGHRLGGLVRIPAGRIGSKSADLRRHLPAHWVPGEQRRQL